MMYPKLAFDNIRKNSRTYFPYILTCIFTIAMYYIMKSLSLNKSIENMIGADTVAYTLKLGSNIIAIFAAIFLFYTNSFLTKNRKKEFGLYNILGMEKRHIAKVIGYESIYVAVISLVCGFCVGFLLDKLMYLIIAKIIRADISFGFYISGEAIVNSAALFGIIFLLIFLNSLRMIHLSKPIELLNGGNTGEKEPKAKWFTALLGLGCLGVGYYISLTIKNPIMALSVFFVAVILVIAGTYLIFSAGSITFLKILKKNKRYYYKTSHFISISGMMYRMKQNAVGLANICILSTMVLVMVSSTGSLIAGIEDTLLDRYPYQIEIYGGQSVEKTNQAIVDIIDQKAESDNIKTNRKICYTELQFMAVYDGVNTFNVNDSDDLSLINNICNLFFITAEDYAVFTGRDISLEKDEVIFYSNRDKYKKDTFDLFGKTYRITEYTESFVGNGMVSADICSTHGIVVSDMSVISDIYEQQKNAYGDNASDLEFYLGIDIDGNTQKQLQFFNNIQSEIKNSGIKCNVDCREENRSDAYGLYGSLFFLGIFLGLLFTMATVLIIYYKQISEGYDDKDRFEIMQKVGMSRQEIKSSIRSQVLTVFFMPLFTAGIHIVFAFPIVRKILAMLQLTNTKLFMASSICVFLAFAVIYAIIYMLTAKTYYKIVKK
ncbi:MAG: ABC transporter permease [Clostridium sp.]|nr:ABC transporter permease [Clostridium sp.]MCM1547184.1 ABC transporter permease [Ruminococcus sp.]